MAASTAFTVAPPCAWACQATLHSQDGPHLRALTGLASQQRRLVGHYLRQRKAAASSLCKTACSRLLSISASSEFAQKESTKFQNDLAEELRKYENLSDVRGRIAEICAKALHNYAATYTGGLEGKPIEDMKKALQEAELPYEQALCCAIWWVRAYLRRDWEQFRAARR